MDCVMNIIGYIRVSTDQQADSRLGLDAQQNACQNYAEKIGQQLHALFSDEGLSGSLSLEKRPGMLDAISALKRGDVLIVAKRDRLGRDPLVVAMIESAVTRKGARIISATGEGTENDDPSSILMRRMIDAFSEYERLIIGARTKSALSVKKNRGERVGHIPFGFKISQDGVKLLPDECEQITLASMENILATGKSIRDAAKLMNEMQMFNRGGAKWNHASLHRVARGKGILK